MNKTVFALLGFLLAGNIAGAQIESFFPDTINRSFSYLTGAHASFEVNSGVIDMDFASTFYNGGHIDKSAKDRVSKRLTGENRMGADLSYGVYHVWKPDSFFNSRSDVSMFVQLKNNEHFHAQFSRDLFRIAFYGNRQFAGDTAFVGNFDLNVLRYQEMQFGVLWSGLDSSARLGIGLSVLNAEQYFSVQTKHGELFTSADGAYIDFNTEMEAQRSDTGNTGFGKFNGFGFSADFFFEAPYKGNRYNGKLSISVSDVGLLFWNEKTLVHQADSLYHYEGIEVDNIFDMQDSTGGISADSVFNNITTHKKQSFAGRIPSTIHLRHSTYYGRFELAKGFKYVFNASYKGFFYLEGNYNFGNKLNVGVTGGFGGYGKFSFGAHASKMFGKGLYVMAGSSHLEGLIAPKSFGGLGGYAGLRYQF